MKFQIVHCRHDIARHVSSASVVYAILMLASLLSEHLRVNWIQWVVAMHHIRIEPELCSEAERTDNL